MINVRFITVIGQVVTGGEFCDQAILIILFLYYDYCGATSLAGGSGQKINSGGNIEIYFRRSVCRNSYLFNFLSYGIDNRNQYMSIRR